MLKTIRTDQLRLGMFIHQFSGAWLSHPFWRRQFLLRDARDLEKLRSLDLSGIVIDTDRGLDVMPAEPPAAEGPLASEDVAGEAPPASPAPALPPMDEPIVLPLPDAHPALALAGPTFQEAAALSRQAVRQAMDLYGAARLGHALDAGQCLGLVEEVVQSVTRRPHALISIARLKSVSDYTYLHAVAVCALMAGLARQLGWAEPDIRQAALAGLLLDVGKATLPDDLVQRAGTLSEDERAVMRTHVQRGYELLRAEGGYDARVLQACLHHHERLNGSGYPGALQGEDIPLIARMAAICDVYDAVTSQRPYREAWDPGEAMRRMARSKGLYDPTLMQHFVKAVGIYPVGALVRLRSELLGVVTAQGQGSLLTPKVRVFFSLALHRRIDPYVLDLAKPGCADRIADLESPEGWRFADLEAQWLGA
ncbi:HD-GYP domain-containing protein [Ideonella sp. B508-1]|uniref:HD-GYP domain-containing protein n=1 Tax=Ideonella sp. B508-1 TaxID=137716 RepID=UPI000475A52A|nr:HD-GYP domain-containing protein [Ideonella sp. B508-1]